MASCDNYQIIKTIGSGAYGIVYEVTNKDDDKIYAIKHVGFRNISNNELYDDISETDVLFRLKHPYIIPGIEILDGKKCKMGGLIYVLPLGSYTFTNIIKSKFHDFETKMSLLYKIGLGLEFLHSNNIIHADFKPENIILIDDNTPMIIDFGLSLQVDNIKTGKIVPYQRYTRPYRPPETFMYRLCRDVSDVWAFGVTIVEVCGYYPSFDDYFDSMESKEEPNTSSSESSDESYIDYLNNLLIKLDKKIPQQYRNTLLDLLSKIFVTNSDKRIDMKQVLQHHSFNNIDKVRVSGTVVSPKAYKPNNNELFKSIINDIVNVMNTILININAKAMFLTVHLIFRISNYYENKPYHIYLLAGICCMTISHILINGQIDYNASDYLDYLYDIMGDKINKLKAKMYIEEQLYIIKLLDGIINYNPLYDKCTNGTQVTQLYKQVIMDIDIEKYTDENYINKIINNYSRYRTRKNINIGDMIK